MDYILFGIQGSGKGTQGKIIAKKFDYAFFETGYELRKLAKEESKLGHKIKNIIEAGHLVSNDVVMEIVENFISQVPKEKSIIFDGIPRKQEQSKTFNALLKKLNRDFTGILINISKKEALQRLSTRRICENCKKVYPSTYSQKTCENCGGKLVTRKDDNPESINTRLNAFFNETKSVIEEYEQNNKIIIINGEQTISEVNKELLSKVQF